MTTTNEIGPAEQADRLAIRELVDAYAHCADRRSAEAQKSLFTEDGERKLMVAWLRYGDTFVKLDGKWLFAERNLIVDWTETRPSHP
jgi:SnoaL-like domain